MLLKFILAIALGAIIGLEREIYKQKYKYLDFAGVRSFILIALFGAMSAYLSQITMYILLPISFIILSIILAIAYYVTAKKSTHKGITTIISAIITYFISVLVIFDFLLLAVVLAIIILIILALKFELHKFAKGIQKSDLFAAIKFAIITVLILPFLPNKAYTLLDIPILNNFILLFPTLSGILSQINIFNPYKIWLLVVLIASIGFIGYLLSKLIGSKGIFLNGLIGGLVSSTATTISYAGYAKASKYTNIFAVGIIGTSVMSFIRALFIVSAVNTSLASSLILPITLISVFGLLAALFLTKKATKHHVKINLKTPFAIIPAIKFGLLLVLIMFIISLLNILLGMKGIYFASLFSGLIDIDAVILTLSTSGLLDAIAANGILIAICANMATKGFLAYYISNGKLKHIPLIFLIIIIIMLLFVLF